MSAYQAHLFRLNNHLEHLDEVVLSMVKEKNSTVTEILQLASVAGFSSYATTHKCIDNLLSCGFVKKASDKKDARVKHIEVTKAGVLYLKKVSTFWSQV